MTNRYFRASAFSGLLLLACLGATSRVFAQSSGYRIAGKVVNSITGAPVSQALVTIAEVKDQSDTKSLVTGDDGAFAFRGLPAGKYSLMAARRGYITSGYDAHEHFSNCHWGRCRLRAPSLSPDSAGRDQRKGIRRGRGSCSPCAMSRCIDRTRARVSV